MFFRDELKEVLLLLQQVESEALTAHAQVSTHGEISLILALAKINGTQEK